MAMERPVASDEDPPLWPGGPQSLVPHGYPAAVEKMAIVTQHTESGSMAPAAEKGRVLAFVLPPPRPRQTPRAGTQAATNLQMRRVTDGIAPNLACVIAARMGNNALRWERPKALLRSLDLVNFTTGYRFKFRLSRCASVALMTTSVWSSERRRSPPP
jgi:hypothetical protein